MNAISTLVMGTITVSGRIGRHRIDNGDWQFLIFLLVVLGIALALVAILGTLSELGCRANRHRGQLPRPRDVRLLYTIRFDGGPAGAASLRIMSDSEAILTRLKTDCPEPFRILLAPDAIGQATLQSETILSAIEHTLPTLGSPASAPALYTQLRTVRDLMRRHPYTRFQRIIDTPHPGPTHIPTAHLATAEPQKCQGFAVILSDKVQPLQRITKPA